MQSAMFSALFGALSNEHRLNSIANNLANIHTTGYKRDLIAFKDTFTQYAHDYMNEPVQSLRSEKMLPAPVNMSRVRIAESYTDFSQGALKATGGPFDVAISGGGFFRVLTPQGEMYSRNGHFRLTGEGLLVTEQGFPVLSDGGEITLPEGVTHFTIAEDGRIFADNVLVGQISLVDIDNPHDLEKMGQNMFRPRDGAEIVESEETTSWMVQGFLETPNVDAVYEMVNMIEAQRQFEAYAKLMQTSEAMDKEASTKVGRGR